MSELLPYQLRNRTGSNIVNCSRFAGIRRPLYQLRVIQVPGDIRDWLLSAGWYPGRQVRVDPRVPTDHPAWQALAEFGGLCLTKLWGDYLVKEVDFQYSEYPDDTVADWERALGTRLIAIADTHNAHGRMYMSNGGFLFGCSEVHPAFWFAGRSLAETLTNIFTGVRDRPMLLEHEQSVKLYEGEYTRDDPEVLTAGSPELIDA